MACELPNSDTDIRLRSGAYQHPSRVTSKEALKQLIDKQISWELRHCSCQQPNPDGLFANCYSIIDGFPVPLAHKIDTMYSGFRCCRTLLISYLRQRRKACDEISRGSEYCGRLYSALFWSISRCIKWSQSSACIWICGHENSWRVDFRRRNLCMWVPSAFPFLIFVSTTKISLSFEQGCTEKFDSQLRTSRIWEQDHQWCSVDGRKSYSVHQVLEDHVWSLSWKKLEKSWHCCSSGDDFSSMAVWDKGVIRPLMRVFQISYLMG